MFGNSKYGKVLTVLLIIAIIVAVAALIFLGYDVYQKYYVTNDADAFVEDFKENIVEKNEVNNNTIKNNIDLNENPFENSNIVAPEPEAQGKEKYKGYFVAGTIEIPSVKIKYPVLETVSKGSIEVAVAILIGPKGNDGAYVLNKPGNTVITGHNYRNGLFFSELKKVKNNDTIFITDSEGKTVAYRIYNVYETTPEDTEYMQRDTFGKREISLSTCNDNSQKRVIVWAKEIEQ